MSGDAARSGRLVRSPLSILLVIMLLGLALGPSAPDRGDRSAPAFAGALPAWSPRTATPVAGTDPAQASCRTAELPGAMATAAVPGQPTAVAHDGAALALPEKAVEAATIIRASSVCAQAMAPLDQGMTNVTAGPRRGYRLLPHMTFSDELRITLPYDEDLIPPGLSEQDVRTYFFDERAGVWEPLERVEVDPKAATITSLTDHFTDFVNATVTVPDHPEALANNPTGIADIKAADPGTSVNLIPVPKAGSSGEARLTYPIDLPLGRRGVQPELGLTYDSGGGNGWVGQGWDLTAPAVTIDLRWGVPRYDPAGETETYTLNGQQLTPVAHRGPPQARTAEKVFHTRIEGRFRKIIRHGTNPTNYWWEVVDKGGNRSFYGADPETLEPDPEAQLTDDNGNVFRWALRETRDLHGNGLRYAYQPVSDTGIPGGTVEGRQLYLRSINYTRNGIAPGAYTVTFIRDSQLPGTTRRPDVDIDARGGFKMVTAELLSRIEVHIGDRQIRRYDLGYSTGAFNKTLLRTITQRGTNNAVFNTHELSYFDEVRDAGGAYQGFDGASTWPTGDDGVTAGLLGQGQASALGGTLSTVVGGHLYTGFNPLTPTKQGSAGAKVGFNTSSSETVLAMLDLNGDNLPDKVFRRGSSSFFRLNTSGPDGTTDFAGQSRQLPTLPAIANEDSTTTSAGAEAYLIANVFVNQASTSTTNATYFSDVNGDGLPDLVNGGQVLFNHLDAEGVPTFTADSANTPVPISARGPNGAGVAGTGGRAGLAASGASVAQLEEQFPLHDTVRRWVAPFDGQVAVTGTVALIEDTGAARDRYRTADGVRVAIQHDGAELWTARITGDDYAPRTPEGVGAVTVSKGDHLYFRVGSVADGAFDQVAWDPQIAYLGADPAPDANGLDANRYQASEDFVLAGRRGINVNMPFNGSVRLVGDLSKAATTTDDVTVLVLKNDQTVFSRTLTWDQTGDIPVDLPLDVARQDTIQLRVKVDSPIDASQITWAPRLFYTASPDVPVVTDPQGNPIIQLRPPYDLDIYAPDGLTAPQRPWVVPRTGTVRVTPRLEAAGGTGGTVVFTVKRRGALVAKRTIGVSGGTVPDTSFDLDVTEADEIFFDFSAYDPQLAPRLTSRTVEVAYHPVDPLAEPIVVPSAFHSSAFPGLLPQPYRGWAFAGYNGNGDRGTQPLVEADLEQRFTEDSTYDVRTARAYLLTPFPEQNRWRGPDDLGYVEAGITSSSRVGFDAIGPAPPVVGATATAPSKNSDASQTAVGGGVSFLSGSISDGDSTGETDFLDLNGDRFPDVVAAGQVRYTTPTGGLEGASRAVPGLGDPRDSDNSAVNVGVGGSPAAFFASGRGEVDTAGKAPAKGNTTGGQMTPLGLSAGIGRGDSEPGADLLDVNGDGLPDRVTRGGGGLNVALNLGYGFAPAEPWGDAAINDGASEHGSLGATLGFNGGIYDFAGGLSLTKNKSQTSQTLLDLNGDGLLDRVLPNGSGGLRVGFNTGGGFAAPVGWGGALNGACEDDTSVGLAGIDWDQVRLCSGTTGLGAGAYFTIGIGPLCLLACYIIINPGADGSQNMGRDEAAIRDVDGDGYADHVASTDDASMRVARNRTGRTNLLKSIKRPLGATIDLDYQRDGNTPNQPQSRWVLSRTAVSDGHPGDGADTQVTTYAYEGGVHNRLEREFYGYAKVTESVRDPGAGDAVYRSVVHEFRNDSYYTRGLPARVRVIDAQGRPFTETEHTYLLRDVGTGAEPADARSTTATIFPQLVRTDERFFEGNPTPGKATFSTQRYDALGNVDRSFDAGDTGTKDDVSATIGYAACPDTHVVDTPNSIVVSGDGKRMRRREANVDCATGNVRQVREYLADNKAAVTDLDYYLDGNLHTLTGPENAAKQRYQLHYEWDPGVHTHIAKITDSFGLISVSTFDLRWGRLATTTDTNNNRTTYAYDVFGRTTSVTGPYEQGGTTATIRFEYHPEAAVPWALTRHLDSFRGAADTIDTVLFVDGLKRAVQTKKDATVHTGPGTPAQDVMTVSGRVRFDFAGRTVETFYPVTEPLGTPGTFNPAVDAVEPSRVAYDVMDRTTRVTLPDGSETTTAHGFGGDRAGASQFSRTVTDANGNRKVTYENVRDLVTSLQEFHTPAGGQQKSIWTSYAYDPLDQLVEVSDDRGNRTKVSYDDLGRRTAVETPDAGRTETVYDLASNTVAKITPNLRADREQINYEYEFTRLKKISYPEFRQNDVTYTYGAPGAADNRAGRVTSVSDGSGSEQRFYGRLGEVTKTIRTVDTDDYSSQAYTTLFSYDTFGRLQNLAYPDGEVLTYRYDSGGQIREATGQKGPNSYAYVKRLEYDKFEQRAFMEAGNNTRTSYTYDPIDRRLTNLQTAGALGAPLQNLQYTYDGVGNVLSLNNDVPVQPKATDGGPTTKAFAYDDLYRLTGSSGTFRFGTDKTDRYSLSLSYDTLHNLVTKNQKHELVSGTGRPSVQDRTTYDYKYEYDSSRPHAPKEIDDEDLRYDANGNLVESELADLEIVWDEENRVRSVDADGDDSSYKYDDGGERVVKRSHDGETAYVNPYFTVRNGHVGTKHVFVGNTRIASKLVKSGGTTPPVERDQFFFHPDHIGSTNYVTDADGKVYQHLEYFPSGETWVEESKDGKRTDYRFSGKELDEETGLYYFGARYYDPRTGVWQSPDVAVERYLEGLSQGGVYNSGNLNLYAFGYQNPVKYTDPNGMWVETAWDVFNVGLGVASFVDNVRQGNYGSAALDAVGVVVDGVAAVAPIVPGGVGSVIRASRAADAGIDALQGANRVTDAAQSAGNAADAARTVGRNADEARTIDNVAEPAQAVNTGTDTGRAASNVEDARTVDNATEAAGGPRYVYRGGSRSADNFTPRPGKDPTGLSTFDTPTAFPSGTKLQVIDTSKLKCLVCTPDAPPPGHVSVHPRNPSEIPTWAATRGTGQTHPYTQELLDAVVNTIKAP